jgi:hypothetical protein
VILGALLWLKGKSLTNRVHIDAPAGVIDIEGEKEFVEGMLGKLFPLIEGAGFGSRPSTSEGDETSIEATNFPDENNRFDGSESPKKRGRKAFKQPPAGQSCPARIQVLKDEGFFKEHRAPAEIVAGLRAKGWTHNLNQVGAATSALFSKGTLQRTKNGKGPWMYFWDRD